MKSSVLCVRQQKRKITLNNFITLHQNVTGLDKLGNLYVRILFWYLIILSRLLSKGVGSDHIFATYHDPYLPLALSAKLRKNIDYLISYLALIFSVIGSRTNTLLSDTYPTSPRSRKNLLFRTVSEKQVDRHINIKPPNIVF